MFGEENLQQKPEEEHNHDALDDTLTAEQQHRLPERLAWIFFIVVRHGAKQCAEGLSDLNGNIHGSRDDQAELFTPSLNPQIVSLMDGNAFWLPVLEISLPFLLQMIDQSHHLRELQGLLAPKS